MTLNSIELDVIFFVERYAATQGQAPTDETIKRRFADIDDKFLADFRANELVQKSFNARGIVYPAMADKLTDSQMHAIAVMLDPYDRRSDEKKLRDMGIATRQWAMWMLEDDFATYLRDRSEKLLENGLFEAHKGLLKGARNGNIAAVKTYYEITGRYRPDEEAQIDIRRVLHTFIEVIQKYVKDPVLIHQIAMDLSSAATAESLSTGLSNQMLSSAQAVRAHTIAGEVEARPMPVSRNIDGGE